MNSKLVEFSAACESPYNLALSRILYLDEDNDSRECSGLATQILDLLAAAIGSWPNDASQLLQVLAILEQVLNADITLSEEVAHHEEFLLSLSLQVVLVKAKQLASGIQDSFSLLRGNGVPFSKTELKSRLPLVFAVPQQQEQLMKILIQQPPVVESTDEYKYHDVGLVMWPAAVALARWITKNPWLIANGKEGILEIGAGCGLVGLTVATILDRCCKRQKEPVNSNDASRLYLTDYNPAVLENLGRNIRLNGLDEKGTTVVGLDFFDQPEIQDDAKTWVDMNGIHRPQVGLILAADILCYSNDADLVCNTIQAALAEGGTAIVVSPDGNKRFGVEDFAQVCRRAGLQVEVTTLLADSSSPTGSLSGDERKEEMDTLLHDLEQTCRFTLDYELLMFTIGKPLSE
jgi:predicted nicotinamide N-methyase